jgi:hypothetical protein
MSCSAILGDLSASSNCSEVRWKNGELFPLGGDGIRRPQTQELRKSEIFVRRKIIGSAESWGRKLDPSKQVGSPPGVGPQRPASVTRLTSPCQVLTGPQWLLTLPCIHPSHSGSRLSCKAVVSSTQIRSSLIHDNRPTFARYLRCEGI